jgi:monoamine oxidase
VWQRLKGNSLSEGDQQLLRFLLHSEFESEYAGSAQPLKTTAIGHLSSYWHDASLEWSGDDVVFAKGYEVVSQHLAFQLQGRIRLNEQVQSIDYSGGQVKVITLKGEYTASKVVVAVPLGVMKAGKIKITPTLPAEKLRAIQALQMGLLNKLYLKFDKPFWDDLADEDWIELVQPSNELQPAWVQWVNMKRPLGQSVLLGFSAADAALALEALSTKDVVDQAMSRLRHVFGDRASEPVGVLRTRWMQDPFTLGSYSFNSLGMHQDARQHLAKSVAGRLFFAGEHTHSQFYGTVHGAYLSGLRAAQQVMGTTP